VVAWVGVAILTAVIVACLVAWLLWNAWEPSRPQDGPNTAFDFRVEQPVLESAPRKALKQFMAEKEKLLNSWQWVDPQAGIARIPVEEAMTIMASRPAQNSPAEKKR
jgi:hypothetical protein